MSAVDVVNVKESYGSIGPAKGDGSTNPDDTAAIQGHLTAMDAAQDSRVLVFPPGRYVTSATITQPTRIVCQGLGYPFVSGDLGPLTKVAQIEARHTGTAWQVAGAECGLQNIVFNNRNGTAAADGTVSVLVSGGSSWIDRCSFFRQGKAALQVAAPACRVTHCRIATDTTYQRTRSAIYDGTAPTGVGLWLSSAADGWVEDCEISSYGPGIWAQDVNGATFADLKVFNSNIGLLLWRATRCSFDGLRLDEHDNEGMVLDWGSNSNRFTGLAYSNGALNAGAISRKVGVRIGSGSYNRFDMVFDNLDHGTMRTGFTFMSPQQHGAWIQAFDTNPQGNPNRPVPKHNRIEATYRFQRTSPIGSVGDASNKFVSMGDGIATPAAAQAVPSRQVEPVTAGVAGPAAVAAAAAGLVAFRNRRRPT
jgi:hypothetical protein